MFEYSDSTGGKNFQYILATNCDCKCFACLLKEICYAESKGDLEGMAVAYGLLVLDSNSMKVIEGNQNLQNNLKRVLEYLKKTDIFALM